MYFSRIFILLVGCLLAWVDVNAQDTAQKVVPNRVNAEKQERKPYVILISADGFRYDLASKYHAENLLRLSAGGVKASYMQSSFPSLTFPNHYTIATGLYPAHHGIVDNTFYDEHKHAAYTISNRRAVRDSSWYGGTPIWVLAEKQHMISASFYWVGSESAIQGIRPTYYYDYSDGIPEDKRVAVVKSWLELPENKRPHLITFYFPEVDHAEHKYGPDSKETETAVQLVDKYVGIMADMAKNTGLNVNFIFVSDHGMTTVDTKNTLPLPAAVDTSKFIVPPGSSLLHLYAKNRRDIMPAYEVLKKEAKDFDVYLAEDMPARWHYSKKDDTYDRIGDILLVPHLPKVFNIWNRLVPLGQHGFDPALTDMHATFYAWGPMFKEGKQIGGFENVNVYPLIAKMLGLEITEPVDGKLRILKKILKK